MSQRRLTCWQWLRVFVHGTVTDSLETLLVFLHYRRRATIDALRSPERLPCGLVIVLPGIEGKGHLSYNIVQGLAQGGVAAAIEINDWTTGSLWFGLFHLRAAGRNLRQATRIAERIVAYQDEYPGRPTFLCGHSAGGAVALLVLDALPHGRTITAAVLLGPAISPQFPLASLLKKVRTGIWNFHSRFDLFALRLGTILCGTLDGRHTSAAGAIGFEVPGDLSTESRQLYKSLLHQRPFCFEMTADGNYGGHMDCVRPRFIAKHVAPIIVQGDGQQSAEERDE